MPRLTALFMPMFFVAFTNASDVPPPAQLQSNKPEIVVAGLLGGAVIVPVAQFIAGQWVNTWPTAGEDAPRNISSETDIPKTWYPYGPIPRLWFGWDIKGKSTSLKIGSPTTAQAHCGDIWGYSTERKPTDHETTGLATTATSGVTVFQRMPQDQQLQDLVKSELTRAVALRPNKYDKAATTSDKLMEFIDCATVDNIHEKLCSFYASSAQTVPPQPERTACDDLTVVQGWMLKRKSAAQLLVTSATYTDCDAVMLRTQSPELIVNISGRVFVFAKEHGYEDESFMIYELVDGLLKLMLEVPGTGC